jgi:acyl-CoA synthetase (NDP forming)
VWPVNAGRDTVAGLRCYPSLRDLPGTPDLAVIAVPADNVVDVVRDLRATRLCRRVSHGPAASPKSARGREKQHELAALCREAGFLLVRAELRRAPQHRQRAHRVVHDDAARQARLIPAWSRW